MGALGTSNMKLVLALAGLIACTFASVVPGQIYADGIDIEYFLVDNGDGSYKVEDLVNSTIEARASETDVTFYLFTRQSPNGVRFAVSDLNNLARLGFNANIETIIISHGWNNAYTSEVNTIILNALLPNHPHNIIVVDWSPVANKNYLTAKNAVVPVGRWVANLINNMVQTLRVPLSSLTLIGHSLGAHIVGNAGAAVNGLVGRIIGLDPALPLFSINDISNRLDPTDGAYVQVIHTNGGLLGFAAAIGHSDYYPNGGSSQPGCGIDLAGSCAHSRAYTYLAESYFNDRFVSRSCSSNSDFTNGRCSTGALSRMGGIDVDERATGTYYLTTNSRSLFATGSA